MFGYTSEFITEFRNDALLSNKEIDIMIAKNLMNMAQNKLNDIKRKEKSNLLFAQSLRNSEQKKSGRISKRSQSSLGYRFSKQDSLSNFQLNLKQGIAESNRENNKFKLQLAQSSLIPLV